MPLLSVHRKCLRVQMALVALFAFLAFSTAAAGSELKQETAAAFDRYVRAVQTRMDDDIRSGQFLAVDRLRDDDRKEAYDDLVRGQVYIQELHALEDGVSIRIPGGHIHHWVGVIFVPNTTLAAATFLLEDYEHQPGFFKPQVRQARLIERNGDDSKMFLQIFNSEVATVLLNVNFDVIDTDYGGGRHQIATRSTRVAEIANPGKPNEYERPVGNDHGYVWRFNSCWRVQEKDGGVYIQNESVVLSRSTPAMIAWLVNPMTKKIPRDILVGLLTASRKALTP